MGCDVGYDVICVRVPSQCMSKWAIRQGEECVDASHCWYTIRLMQVKCIDGQNAKALSINIRKNF